MNITEKVSEIKRAIRAHKDAWEGSDADNLALAEGLSIAFSIKTARPIQNLNISLLKSYMESLSKAVSAFSSTEFLSLEFDVKSHNAQIEGLAKEAKEKVEEIQAPITEFYNKIMKDTRENFEASQKLEGIEPTKVANEGK